MKSILTILIPISILATSCVVTRGPVIVDDGPTAQAQPQAQAPLPPPQQQPVPAGNYQQFYDELSPYGQWINNPTYGYVWVPAAGPDFVPYSTAGHWVYSSYGWTWVSDYSWGWAVFHYGLWDYDNFYGWYWIPNSQWGPAWVSWRSSPGYYGWAPLTPEYSFAAANSNYYIPPERYVFVRQEYITSPEVYQYYAPRSEYHGYMNNSTVISRTNYDNDRHTTFMAGPEQGEVERVTGHQVQPVSFNESSTPGHSQVTGGQLSIYRPAIAKVNPGKGPLPAPAKVAVKSEIVAPAHRAPVHQNMNPASKSQPASGKAIQPNENRNEEYERTNKGAGEDKTKKAEEDKMKKAEEEKTKKAEEEKTKKAEEEKTKKAEEEKTKKAEEEKMKNEVKPKQAEPQGQPNNRPAEKSQVQPQPQQPKPQQQPQPKPQPKPKPKPPAPAPENKKQEEKH